MGTNRELEMKLLIALGIKLPLGFLPIFFFIFPIPVLVARSPFPVLVTSGREQQKCSKFKRNMKMRSQGERCALDFRKNFVKVFNWESKNRK